MLQSKSSSKRAADLWSRINNIIGHSKEHKSVVCDTLPLDSLNEYFQTVAVGPTHQGAECFIIPQDSLAPNPFTFNTVSISSVRSHLLSLDITKPTGPDNLSARFLWAIVDQIVSPLTDMFNCSFLEVGRCLLSGSALISLLFTKGMIKATSNQFPLFLYLPRF